MTIKETRSNKHHKKKKVWPIVLKSILIVLMVSVLGVLGYGAKLLSDADDLMTTNFRPRVNAKKDNNDNIQPKTDPFSILLLGVDDNDERDLGSARTDTMIMVTVNPKKGKISMVSVPRDTYTYIESEGVYTKINSAYTYGKEEAAIDAVEKLLEVPVDFYVTVDFEAFEKIVDALDGVKVNVPVAISEANAAVDKMIELEPGEQMLNGEEALAFARTRKIDNDIKRGERQQMVVQSVINRAMEVGSITKYSEVLNSLKDQFITDMNRDTMMQIAKSGLTTKYTFKSYTFSWESFYVGDASMVGLHQDSLDFISHKLKVSLDREEEDERDEKGFKFVSNCILSSKTTPSGGYQSNEDFNSNNSYNEEDYSQQNYQAPEQPAHQQTQSQEQEQVDVNAVSY